MKIMTTLVLGVAAALSLSTSAAAAPAPAEAGIQGIGQQVTVDSRFTQADLKPIPGTAAPNTGIARPGDNLAAICFSNDNRGVQWILVLNRNGIPGRQYANTTGYIEKFALRDGGTLVVNACVPSRRTVTLQVHLTQADMKPIPGTDAPNTGLFKQGDTAAIYCSLADNRGVYWQLLVNLNGHAGQQYAQTVGFVPSAATAGGSEGDCGAS